jgi:hypothetical protein
LPKSPKEESPFARAVAFLDAFEVSPGRYAYRDGASRRYFVVTGGQLERLGRYLEAEIYQRARPWSKVPGGRGYSEWGADTVAFVMPDWWTPENGLDALRRQTARNDRVFEQEKVDSLIRWVRAHPHHATTELVERLKLPHDFHHCVLVDTIRYERDESAREAASALAPKVPDRFAFDDGPKSRPVAKSKA